MNEPTPFTNPSVPETRSPSAAPHDPYETRVPAPETGAEPAEPPPDDRLPLIPGYVILEELGRGGMGVVLRAEDHQLNRDLAVKVLLEEHIGRRGLVARFLEEAQITAQL